MSLGPSTSGFGFVLCKAFFQQLAAERADVHSGDSRRASSSGSNSLADEDGGSLSSGGFPPLIRPNLHLLPWDASSVPALRDAPGRLRGPAADFGERRALLPAPDMVPGQ